MNLISSQSYRDPDTIADKRAERDYTVTVGREIEIDGVACRVVIDGHHSLSAAIADGVEPVIEIASATDCDREGIEDLDDYLDAHWIDCDWHYVVTGKLVF